MTVAPVRIAHRPARARGASLKLLTLAAKKWPRRGRLMDALPPAAMRLESKSRFAYAFGEIVDPMNMVSSGLKIGRYSF